MLDLKLINDYFPASHGEHGVDATLHRIILKQTIFHEVFSNPPGGSWTQFDILRPNSDLIYRWDHMPRVPPDAKRPDLVLQLNIDSKMDFLLIESKKSHTDIYNNIATLLKQFFTGSTGYHGLKNRPPWHFKKNSEIDWSVVKPEIDEKERYWFKKIQSNEINFWTGFAFALTPEYYSEEKSIEKETWIKKMKELLKTYDLDVIIGVSWIDKEHKPVIIKVFSEKFFHSKFGEKLSSIIKKWDISPIEIDRF